MTTVVIRIVGALNMCFALFGAYYFFSLVLLHWHKWPGSPSPSQWAVFFVLSAVSLFLIASLGYLGIKLIKKDATALRGTRNIFICEIIYFIFNVVFFWNVAPLGMKAITVGFWGIAGGALDPQIAIGYPLIGLIATIVLSRMFRRSGTSAPGSH